MCLCIPVPGAVALEVRGTQVGTRFVGSPFLTLSRDMKAEQDADPNPSLLGQSCSPQTGITLNA